MPDKKTTVPVGYGASAINRCGSFKDVRRRESPRAFPCTRLLPPDNGTGAANWPAMRGLRLEERAEAGRPLTLEISFLLESEL
jgi:hypothetical protein